MPLTSMSNYNPIRIAHTLADAYGHGWVKYVTLVQAEEIFASAGGDLAATATQVNAVVSSAEDAEELEGWQRCTGLYTVGAPNSYFTHETASGRTRWQIGASQAAIQITRPGDVVVASATLTASSLEISWPGLDAIDPAEQLGFRHIEALGVAIRALYRGGCLGDVALPSFCPLGPDGGLEYELRPLLAWSAAAEAHLLAATMHSRAQMGGDHFYLDPAPLARVSRDYIDEAARAALRRRLLDARATITPA